MFFDINKISLVSGTGESEHKLIAYDRALQEAGIADLNLIKVSSILPKNTSIEEKPEIEPGSFTPTVIAKQTTTNKETISSSIVIAECKEGIGLICEYSDSKPKEKTNQKTIKMAKKMARDRDKKITALHTESTQIKPKKTGVAVSAAVFWR